ncbi:hypothetical protein C0995_002259 [Termitomyces sp. Mi166|nr:hypothetical protein C0995_002259 [Termitomyces sp. Mi166\
MLDPAVLPPGRPSSARLAAHFRRMAKLKGDKWANINEARQELLNKGGFRYFAPEVFEFFLVRFHFNRSFHLMLNAYKKYALRPADTPGAVTLASTRAHDIAFHSSDQVLDPSGEALLALCKEDKVPIHLVICPKDELRGLSDEAKVWQTDVIGKTSNGSVQQIEKGGHLFPQVEPILAAHHVRTALLKIWDSGARL